jgi:membrane-anchored protein YejM (alkaline phosphatase superfamily)
MLLFVVVTSVAFTALVEWPHLGERFYWWRLGPQDELLLVGILVGKSLWVFALPLILAAGLVYGRRPRVAWALVVSAEVAVFAWSALDLHVNETLGTHLTAYVPFLRWSDWELGTGAGWSVWPIVDTGVRTGLLVAVAAWLFSRLEGVLARRRRWVGTGPGALVLSAGYLVAGLGVMPAIARVDDAGTLQQLDVALPIALPGLAGRLPQVADGDEFRRRFHRAVTGPALRFFDRLTPVSPIDATARLPDGPRPNVLLLVPEDLQADALDPRWMPRLAAWAKGGLTLGRHYAGTNASQLGYFALLYGRHPLLYDLTLDAGVQPQLVETLRSAGYRTAYLASSPLNPNRLSEIINGRTFDRLVLDTEGVYWERDRRTLGRAATLLSEPPGSPWFVVVSLMATHALYQYPAEYERFTPVLNLARVPPFWVQGAPSPELRQAIVNRYRNSLAFTDDAVADLLAKLDPERTLTVLTTDHGNSFYDDGSWMHLGPLSEIQTRVFLVLRGPGIPPGLVTETTMHAGLLPTLLHALAGRHVPVRHVYGRDWLKPRSWPDQVLLSKSLDAGEMILVRGAARLELRVSRDPRALFPLGFVDANARLDPTIRARPEAAAEWATALAIELERVAR